MPVTNGRLSQLHPGESVEAVSGDGSHETGQQRTGDHDMTEKWQLSFSRVAHELCNEILNTVCRKP